MIFSDVIAFADNIKLYGKPGHEMQADLQKIWEWSIKNHMPINIDKCVVMHFSADGDPGVSYVLNGSELPFSEVIKVLGLHIDDRLTFQNHLCILKTKCYRMVNLIFKFFCVRDCEIYCKLYKIYVLPHILYGVPLYSNGSNACFIKKLKRFRSILPNVCL